MIQKESLVVYSSFITRIEIVKERGGKKHINFFLYGMAYLKYFDLGVPLITIIENPLTLDSWC